MIDLKKLSHPPDDGSVAFSDQYKKSIQNRGGDPAVVDQILELNSKRKKLNFSIDDSKFKLKSANQKIVTLKKAGKDASPLLTELKAQSREIKSLEAELAQVEQELNTQVHSTPNMLSEDTPFGESEDDNVLYKTVGERPQPKFKVKEHWELGEERGLIDFARAGEVTGSRFAFLKGDLARLERALIQFFLDFHTKDNKYTEILAPYIVNSKSLFGTGQLPKFSEDLFKLENTDYFLIPTAEVPLTNYYSDTILKGADLPVCLTGFTPCFRSEAGSYGKDTKGLIRQHQFHKVELVKFCHPDDSEAEHEKLLSDAEGLLQALELSYEVRTLCSKDISFSAAKCYDINVWLPGQNQFREISSCSNFLDFQARRANIRFKDESMKKPQFVHTLNGSGLAVGRTLIAIMENYQNADGSIRIPSALKKYMNNKDII